ncbi:MAG TPA: proton-conducting transporter membrane subunit [Devosiaceae bacterium]|jgi:multicomponent Na+:H+ antiporter subunit D
MSSAVTPIADWIVVLPVLACLMGAALLLMLRQTRLYLAGLAIVVVVAVIACEAALLQRVLVQGPLTMTMGRWLPPFGISFSADIMGAAFALAAAVVTLVVLVYVQMDRAGSDNGGGLHALILLLLGGVTGSFLTGDLFNLYVWFEVMLIASFGLMVIAGRDIQLDATVKYGFLNFLATTFFLLALGLLYGLVGTLNMADIIVSAPGVNSAAMASVAALFFLAFATKAAAFPVNAWLPASYHAPPAALSALFAGLLTKVGVYALLRTLVALLPASRAVLEPAILAVAVLTLLIAPLGAIAETNLRRALGFIVIGGIGVVIAGLALPSQHGITGAIFYVLHAMLTMSALYLVAGLIEKATGERDTRRMGGLYAASTPISILFLVLVLAASGTPPFLGFWPKLVLLGAGVEQAGLGQGGVIDYGALVLTAALLVNALVTLIAGTRLWAHIFWRQGPEGELSEQPNPSLRPLERRVRWFGLLPAAGLTAVIVVAGLLPDQLFQAASMAAGDLLSPQRYIASVGLAVAP